MTGNDAGDGAEVDSVLGFWFAPGRDAVWFARDDAFDAAVRDRLSNLHRRAAAGDLADWTGTARGCLALVILLDQVPRNLFRGEARSFAHGAAARDVARHAVERGFDSGLVAAERLFLYLPLEHSEAAPDQDLCLQLVAALGNEQWTRYAERHREIIARFGRFPHRNAVLGRESTAEELAFLEEPDSAF